MADTKITKTDDALLNSKMMRDDKGNIIGIVVEDPRPNDDGTRPPVLKISGTFGPINTNNISPVYMDYKRPAWYARLWRWIRGR